jgi:hypothetical protein
MKVPVSNTNQSGTGTTIFQPSHRLSGKNGRTADGGYWHAPE